MDVIIYFCFHSWLLSRIFFLFIFLYRKIQFSSNLKLIGHSSICQIFFYLSPSFFLVISIYGWVWSKVASATSGRDREKSKAAARVYGCVIEFWKQASQQVHLSLVRKRRWGRSCATCPYLQEKRREKSKIERISRGDVDKVTSSSSRPLYVQCHVAGHADFPR